MEELTQADIEVLEHETNYHKFLNNYLKQQPILVSNCCSAQVENEQNGEGICADCGDHCFAIRVEE